MDNFLGEGHRIDYVNAGSAISSGDVVEMTNCIGIAVADIAASTGIGAVQMEGVFELATNTGEAWTIGQDIYWDADNDELTSTASSHTPAGMAVELVASTTATEKVLLRHSITAAVNVPADDSVTLAKLAGFFKKGYVNVPLTALREVFSNNITNIAANGGVLASDTTPILSFTNGDTDSALRVAWVLDDVDPIVFQAVLPPDIDVSEDLTVHVRMASESTTDAVGFTSDTYFNEGDTKVEDTSETNQTATYAEKIITIAASDIPAGAQTITCELTPVAHSTDAMYITACWLEYTRTDS
jgi:predicted RecA/RadA family phage recombinase